MPARRPEGGKTTVLPTPRFQQLLLRFWSIPGMKLLLLVFVPPLFLIGLPCFGLGGLWLLVRGEAKFSAIDKTMRLWTVAFAVICFYLLWATGSYLFEFMSTGMICAKPTRAVPTTCWRLATHPWNATFYLSLNYTVFWLSLYAAPASLVCALTAARLRKKPPAR